ncbi:unnamed protein product [Gordionus sp. m RMFG-2023]
MTINSENVLLNKSEWILYTILSPIIIVIGIIGNTLTLIFIKRPSHVKKYFKQNQIAPIIFTPNQQRINIKLNKFLDRDINNRLNVADKIDIQNQRSLKIFGMFIPSVHNVNCYLKGKFKIIWLSIKNHFIHEKEAHRYYFYVRILVTLQLLFCLFSIPWPFLLYLSFKLKVRDFGSDQYWDSFSFLKFIGDAFFPIKAVLEKTNLFIIIVLSLDRYTAICHPLRHKFYCTRKNLCIILFITFIVCLAWQIPLYKWYQVSEHTVFENVSIILSSSSVYGAKFNYRFLTKYHRVTINKKTKAFDIYEITKEILFTYITLVVLFFLNARTFLKFRKHIGRSKNITMCSPSEFNKDLPNNQLSVENVIPDSKVLNPTHFNRHRSLSVSSIKMEVRINNLDDSTAFDHKDFENSLSKKCQIAMPSISEMNIKEIQKKTSKISKYRIEFRSIMESSQNINKYRLTFIIMILIFQYFVLTVPSSFISVTYNYFHCSPRTCLYRDLVTVANFLELVNNSLGFITFFVLDREFRNNIKLYFGCERC